MNSCRKALVLTPGSCWGAMPHHSAEPVPISHPYTCRKWDKTAFQAVILLRLIELEKKKTVPKVSQSMKRWHSKMGQFLVCPEIRGRSLHSACTNAVNPLAPAPVFDVRPPVSFDRSSKRTERTSLALTISVNQNHRRRPPTHTVFPGSPAASFILSGNPNMVPALLPTICCGLEIGLDETCGRTKIARSERAKEFLRAAGLPTLL